MSEAALPEETARALEARVLGRGVPRAIVGRLVALLALIALGTATFLVAAQVHPIWFGDADWYATGVGGLGGAHSLYPAAYLQPHVAVRPPAFNQPPAVVFLAPLAAMGRDVWGALMIAALAVGMVLAWPRLPGAWGWILAGAILVWIPVPDVVIWANLNSVVLLLVAIAARWPRHAGWAIGLATALRLAPVFLFAWLIGRRDWRGVLTGLAVAIGLTLLAAGATSPGALWDFVLVRWFEAPVPSFGAFGLVNLGLPPSAGYLVAAGIAALAAWRGSLTLAILASLAAVPELHYHYWILLLVPLLRIGAPRYWLTGEVLRSTGRRLRSAFQPA